MRVKLGFYLEAVWMRLLHLPPHPKHTPHSPFYFQLPKTTDPIFSKQRQQILGRWESPRSQSWIYPPLPHSPRAAGI